jgi:hypothetical protein
VKFSNKGCKLVLASKKMIGEIPYLKYLIIKSSMLHYALTGQCPNPASTISKISTITRATTPELVATAAGKTSIKRRTTSTLIAGKGKILGHC